MEIIPDKLSCPCKTVFSNLLYSLSHHLLNFCPFGFLSQFFILLKVFPGDHLCFLYLWGKRLPTTLQRAALVLREEEQLIFGFSTALPRFHSASNVSQLAHALPNLSDFFTLTPSVSNSRYNGSWECLSTARSSCLDWILKTVNSVIRHLLMV